MPQTAEAGDAGAPAEAVGPLERGLTVLRAMAAEPGVRQRPGDLARTTGLARSTVDRITSTLEHLGYLRAEGQDLLLAPRLMELGNAYLSSAGLSGTLGPHATALADALDESVSVTVPDGDGVRFVVQATRRRTLSLAFRIGDLLPPERCAPGALFAAGWDPAQRERWRQRLAADPSGSGFPAVPASTPAAAPDRAASRFEERVRAAREHGWAVDDQLVEPGLIAVALPVRDAAGTVVCAVSVVSHTSRHSAASLAAHALPPLRRTVGAMEAALREPAAPTDAAGTDAAGSGAAAGAADALLKEELGTEFLQSLARGLTVLRVLGTARGGLALSRVAEAAALPRATARRSLITLQHHGYVRAEGPLFALTPRVLELGYARLSALDLAQLVRPHLVRLTARVGESSSVAVLDGDDIRYVARSAAGRIMSVTVTVGTRLPCYATAMGRVLLAGLPGDERADRLGVLSAQPLTPRTRTGAAELTAALDRAADQDYALVDGELEPGLRSIAVPLRDRHGRVVAAVNVAQHAGRGTPQQLIDGILPELRATAAAMAADLAVRSEHHPLAPG